MEQLYRKLGYYSEFEKIDIGPILDRFEYEMTDNVVNKDRASVVPLFDTTGSLFWQNYPPSLAFARNFYKNCTPLCEQIYNILKIVQKDITPIDTMSSYFYNTELSPYFVNLIRIRGEVQAHRDYTRKYSLSIGIGNSSNYSTYVVDSDDPKNYDFNDRQYYVVSANEVYLTNVNKVHGVIPKDINNITTRYIFTYNMV